MFLVAGGALIPTLAMVPVSAWSASVLRRRLPRRPTMLLFSACLSTAIILTATLLREIVPLVVSLVRDPGGTGLPTPFASWSDDGWRRLSYDTVGSTQIALNALLFVPAGIAWTAVTARPRRVIAALAGGSALIELLQALTGLGAADIADFAANTAGGAVGAVGGTLLIWAAPSIAGRSRPTRREMTRALGVVVGVCAVVAAFVVVGADRRQSSLEAGLADRFAGTTAQDYRAWEARDVLEQRVIDGAASVASDGEVVGPGWVAVRYPASFFGLRRCVFVLWGRAAVDVRGGSGSECTQLLAGRVDESLDAWLGTAS
jgi:hypothetical protein